jgi:hypothetical protein
MKLAFGLFVFFWILCGGIGAWMDDELNRHHWKKVAWGPLTLIEAINEGPITYPWQKVA